ncbi:MAG: peptidylprolyl isomerase [Candidatus Woesearchaeota archaeon]|nr:peptidylprolyl isomerase [Candidatus Woesearchaeota archaeon]
MAVINTSKGIIKVELDREHAPLTVNNFVKYANNRFYDDLIFHRVIAGFMIQGGGFDEEMNQKAVTYALIKNEATNGLKNKRSTIAMARTSMIDSATSQFFINLIDNSFLDHRDETSGGYGYAVFGKVIEGMDVVDAISLVETGSKNGFDDVPLETVKINSIRIN